ncbi:MAG TPA: POTRA domain-containing protein, partial [Kofleriaceae bacterium]|nr:POTRA domain-containing protein [Kofleriaceae bacterium]
KLDIDFEGASAARARLQLKLGPAYRLGRIIVTQPGGLALSEKEIRAHFGRERDCLLTVPVRAGCDDRFTHSQHNAEKKQLEESYRRRGFPSVRIDTTTDFKRRTKTVDVYVRIDERRHIDVVFEGHDPDRFTDDKLRSLLTFSEAGSADDVEANASAAALTTYLQGRGYFEARVTWKRERFRNLDQLVFRISAGKSRRVSRVEFEGNHKRTDEQLTELIATRPYGSVVRLLGNAPPVTAQQLEHDADRILREYRRLGYRDAKIEIAAGPTPQSLSSLSLGLAQIATSRSDGGMYVRFTIDEGNLTFLRTIEVALPINEDPSGSAEDISLTTDESKQLCDQILSDLQKKLNAQLATRRDPWQCVATAEITYLEEEEEAAADVVRDLLRSQGRSNSSVEMETRRTDRTGFALRFRLRHLQPRRMGRVILRGNFRTDRDVILGELGFKEGLPLTANLSSEGQSRLRATGLFDAVNVTYIDGDGVSHAVVHVEERFDARAQLDLEGGASYLNGNDPNLFLKGRVSLPNLGGRGIKLDLAATLGTELTFIDASVRVPRFLVRRWLPLAFDAELSTFWRQQDTDRFGSLLTKGLTVASSRSWQRNNTGGRAARALSTGLRYDFRLRDRQVETIRPAGPGAADNRIPVTTRAGALALTFDWEQRVKRSGALSPLAPEDGFRLQASISFASPYLL